MASVIVAAIIVAALFIMAYLTGVCCSKRDVRNRESAASARDHFESWEPATVDVARRAATAQPNLNKNTGCATRVARATRAGGLGRAVINRSDRKRERTRGDFSSGLHSTAFGQPRAPRAPSPTETTLDVLRQLEEYQCVGPAGVSVAATSGCAPPLQIGSTNKNGVQYIRTEDETELELTTPVKENDEVDIFRSSNQGTSNRGSTTRHQRMFVSGYFEYHPIEVHRVPSHVFFVVLETFAARTTKALFNMKKIASPNPEIDINPKGAPYGSATNDHFVIGVERVKGAWVAIPRSDALPLKPVSSQDVNRFYRLDLSMTLCLTNVGNLKTERVRVLTDVDASDLTAKTIRSWVDEA